MVEAAAQVFLDHGYIGATIPAIAARAGVSLQTVYRAAPGKAGLLAAAVRSAMAGGSVRADVPVEDRPAIRAIIEEPDPAEQLRLYAHTQSGIWERVGPLMRVLEAAAVSEPELRQLQLAEDAQRHAGLTRFAHLLATHGALRTGLTVPTGGGHHHDPVLLLDLRQPGLSAPLDTRTVRGVADRHAPAQPSWLTRRNKRQMIRVRCHIATPAGWATRT